MARFQLSCAALLSVWGCAVDISVPDGVRIECTTDAQCPSGMLCRPRLGMCVRPGADDTPPGILASEVRTPIAGPNRPLEVAFSVDDELSEPPVVRLGSPEGTALDQAERDGGAYVFSLTPDTSITEGSWPVLVDLVDDAGNAARAVALGSVVIDHTSPEVVGVSVLYTPDPGNPLSAVSELRDGTRFVLYFSTTEPVTLPVVTAACPGPPETWLSLAATSGPSATFFAFALTLDAGVTVADGGCALDAAFADLAGNSGNTAAIANVAFRIDRTAPDPDFGIDLTAVKQVRAPYGAWQTRGAPGQFLVPAGTGVDDDLAGLTLADATFRAELGNALAEVRAYTAEAGGLLLGIIRRGGAGWSVPSFQADSAEMWLSLIDAAGNESERRRVPTSEWVVTLGGKRYGSTFENPVSVQRTAAFRSTRQQDPNTTLEPVQADLDAMVAADAASAVVAGEGVWRRHFLTVAASPPGTYRKTMTYDPVSGGVYLFGGYHSCSPGETFGGLWRWDGNTWREVGREEQFRPAIRDGVGLAADPRRGRLIVFSGAEQSSYADTWEWSLADERWLDSSAPELDPPQGQLPLLQGRRSMGFVYDSGRDVFVMFSGMSGSGRPEPDFWEWDVQANVWYEPQPTGPTPAPRNTPGLAYDAANGLVVLYGGWDYDNGGCPTGASLVSGICVFGDTWTWDGATSTWTLVAADGAGPPGRSNHVLVYDPVAERVLTMGGDRGSTSRNDLWQWTLAGGWQELFPSGTPPSVRTGHGAAFDPLRNRLVVHAGERVMICPAPEPATWEWDPAANTWNDRTPQASQEWPAGRPQNHTLASLGPAGGVIMYGGVGTGQNREVWRYDALVRRWTYLSGGPSFAAGVYEDVVPAIAIDPGRSRLVVLGQVFSGSAALQVAEMSLTANTWSFPAQAGQVPWPRSATTLAYDPSRSRVVLFGGMKYDASASPCPDGAAKVNQICFYNDLREWNGGTWTQRAYGGGPGARQGMRLAFDAVRNEIVIAGGQGSDGQVRHDTWRWHGAGGTMAPGATTSYPVAPGSYHTLSYDAERDKTLAYNGTYSRGYVIEYDAATDNWTERVTSVVRPLPVRLAAAAFDQRVGSLIAFGGEDSPDALWEWNGGAKTRPAMLFRVPLVSSGASRPVVRIDVRVRGSGRGYAGSVPQDGLRLLLWEGGGWRDAGGATATPDEYQLSLTSSLALRRALTDDVAALLVAVTPTGDNGQSVDMAEVALDAFEARITYGAP